jgi:hypothetical protein
MVKKFLCSYWSEQNDLAYHWLEEFANFTPAYLINQTLLGISKRLAASKSTFIIGQLYLLD